MNSEQYENKKHTLDSYDTYYRGVKQFISKVPKDTPLETKALLVIESLKKELSSFFKDKEPELERLLNSLKEKNFNDEENLTQVLSEHIFTFAKDNFTLEELENNNFEVTNTRPGMTSINRLLSYSIDESYQDGMKMDKGISIHINHGSSIKGKLKLVLEGFHTLAHELETKEELKDVSQITGKSWILGKNPGLAEKFGFTIDEALDIEEGEKGMVISREKFLELYSKD